MVCGCGVVGGGLGWEEERHCRSLVTFEHKKLSANQSREEFSQKRHANDR